MARQFDSSISDHDAKALFRAQLVDFVTDASRYRIATEVKDLNFSAIAPKSLSSMTFFGFRSPKASKSQLYPRNRFNFTAFDNRAIEHARESAARRLAADEGQP